MNEDTRKKIVFMALFVAIVWGVYNFLPSSKKPTSDVQQAGLTSTVASKIAIPAAGALDKTINVAEMKKRKWGQDPFRGKPKRIKTRSAKSRPVWKLSGIVYNTTRPLAIINGRAVTEGEVLNSAKVIKIERRKVILEYSGDRFNLTISKR